MLTRQLHNVEKAVSCFALLPELSEDSLGWTSSQVRKFHSCIFSILVQSLSCYHLSPIQQWRTLLWKDCHLPSSRPTSQKLFGKHCINCPEFALWKKIMGTFRWMLEIIFLPNGWISRHDVYCLWPVRRLSLFRGLNPSLLPHSSKRLSLSAAPLSLFPSLVLLNDEKCSSSFSPGQSLPPSLLKWTHSCLKQQPAFSTPPPRGTKEIHKHAQHKLFRHTTQISSPPSLPCYWFITTTILGKACMVVLVKDICGIALIRSQLGANANLSCTRGRGGLTCCEEIQVFRSGLVL